MKKSYLIILVIIILAISVGLVVYFTAGKDCKDLNERQCKKNDSCLSTLIPCTDPSCPAKAVFQACKDKPE